MSGLKCEIAPLLPCQKTDFWRHRNDAAMREFGEDRSTYPRVNVVSRMFRTVLISEATHEYQQGHSQASNNLYGLPHAEPIGQSCRESFREADMISIKCNTVCSLPQQKTMYEGAGALVRRGGKTTSE